MKQIDFSIFIVNGVVADNNYCWLEICLANITQRLSKRYSYKIFLWNHDTNNNYVKEIINQYSEHLIELTINKVDIDKYDPSGEHIVNKGFRFSKGFHVHRTPLQLLYEYSIKHFKFRVFFTFDTDSWPLRNNWDLILMHILDSGKKLVGIWRDELVDVIPPYIHPSCLGMKTDVFQNSKLRFDQIPNYPLEDSLSNITDYIINYFGEDAIFKLKRSNLFQYHSVFNGVYGKLVYHHHFGTRFMDRKRSNLKSFGWSEREEIMSNNYLIMESTTEMIFSNIKDFEDLLLYGKKASDLKKYRYYLRKGNNKYRIAKLFLMAKQLSDCDVTTAFYILNLINSENCINNDEFIDLYLYLATKMHLPEEANAYNILRIK